MFLFICLFSHVNAMYPAQARLSVTCSVVSVCVGRTSLHRNVTVAL